ncbi:MAG: hypothetical protein Q4G52_08050 [Clostridia bacterium]|nr:hypothetical protein [Clostridia bacterium]
MNPGLMTQNWQEERMGVVKCQLDLETALARKTDYNNNSWFAFGRFEADGHVLDYLFHIMQLEFSKLMGGIKYQTVVTVLDETTGDYYAKELQSRGKAGISLPLAYRHSQNRCQAGNYPLQERTGHRFCVCTAEQI